MEGSKPIDKTLCLQWDLVCAIVNPKGRCAKTIRKSILGEDNMENMKRTTEKVALDKYKLEFVLSERNITKEEDLRSNSCDGFDIVKIYKIRIESIYELSKILNIENLELIWERTETKCMTAEEMRKKLEELTGEKVEVEPSREEMIGACYGFCRNYPVMLCNGCPLREVENCNFEELTNEELKECYEKVIANESN